MNRATCDRLHGATNHSGAAHIRGLDGVADLSSATAGITSIRPVDILTD